MTRADPMTIENGADARGALGKLVRIEGVARDAKLSGVVVAGDLVVHCLDVPSWPAEVSGKRVTVEGVLEQTDDFAARKDPSGAVSQGTAGGDLVITKSRRLP